MGTGGGWGGARTTMREDRGDSERNGMSGASTASPRREDRWCIHGVSSTTSSGPRNSTTTCRASGPVFGSTSAERPGALQLRNDAAVCVCVVPVLRARALQRCAMPRARTAASSDRSICEVQNDGSRSQVVSGQCERFIAPLPTRPSRLRDCHFADPLSPSLLIHLLTY